MLNLLHDTHTGVVRMKGLTLSRVWWSSIDADIERLYSQCVFKRNIQKILPNLHFQYGIFPQVHGKDFTSTMQDSSMV